MSEPCGQYAGERGRGCNPGEGTSDSPDSEQGVELIAEAPRDIFVRLFTAIGEPTSGLVLATGRSFQVPTEGRLVSVLPGEVLEATASGHARTMVKMPAPEESEVAVVLPAGEMFTLTIEGGTQPTAVRCAGSTTPHQAGSGLCTGVELGSGQLVWECSCLPDVDRFAVTRDGRGWFAVMRNGGDTRLAALPDSVALRLVANGDCGGAVAHAVTVRDERIAEYYGFIARVKGSPAGLVEVVVPASTPLIVACEEADGTIARGTFDSDGSGTIELVELGSQ